MFNLKIKRCIKKTVQYLHEWHQMTNSNTLPLKASLTGRIKRLPKPKNTREALLPLWEAVMNAVYAVRENYKGQTAKLGKIKIEMTPPPKDNSGGWKISIADNGVGLDEKRFEAFRLADTPYRIQAGGKGVGRLLWLAAFERIKIKSCWKGISTFKKRSFGFKCSDHDAFYDLKEEPSTQTNTQTTVYFDGLKPSYATSFPQTKYKKEIDKLFLREFFAILMGNDCPKITFNIENEETIWPKHLQDYILKKEELTAKHPELEKWGNFTLKLLECSPELSGGQDGKSQIHFLAHERIVSSEKLDGILGFGDWSDEDGKKRRLQVLVSGPYLDDHVNQERTDFTFTNVKKILDEITHQVALPQIDKFIKDPVEEQKEKQISSVKGVLKQYPSVAFDTPKEISKKLPRGQHKAEEIYSRLSIERYRRDRTQNTELQKVFTDLKNPEKSGENFLDALENATKKINETNQRSLAEYVTRRKLVLNMLFSLLRHADWSDPKRSAGREEALHSLICPMRSSTIGTSDKPSSHELWVLDESLTFTKYYASDLPFKKIKEDEDSIGRPDLLIFDNAYALIEEGDEKRPSKILIVEFKRPQRSDYAAGDNPIEQVESYMSKLQNGKITANGKTVVLDEHCYFECYIIADVQCSEKMKNWVAGLDRINHQQGYFKNYGPRSQYPNSTLQIIQWDDLLENAKQRNNAFFDRAGLN